MDYKERIFLGELVPIDFTFKCRQGCEIIDASLNILNISDEVSKIDETKKGRNKSVFEMRKSTSMPLNWDENDTENDLPFDIANSPEKEAKDIIPEIYY